MEHTAPDRRREQHAGYQQQRDRDIPGEWQCRPRREHHQHACHADQQQAGQYPGTRPARRQGLREGAQATGDRLTPGGEDRCGTAGQCGRDAKCEEQRDAERFQHEARLDAWEVPAPEVGTEARDRDRRHADAKDDADCRTDRADHQRL